MIYEKPMLIVLGDASELILGGGSFVKDCCDCQSKATNTN